MSPHPYTPRATPRPCEYLEGYPFRPLMSILSVLNGQHHVPADEPGKNPLGRSHLPMDCHDSTHHRFTCVRVDGAAHPKNTIQPGVLTYAVSCDIDRLITVAGDVETDRVACVIQPSDPLSQVFRCEFQVVEIGGEGTRSVGILLVKPIGCLLTGVVEVKAGIHDVGHRCGLAEFQFQAVDEL